MCWKIGGVHPLEGEACDAVGRDYYEHGAQPGQGYRNGYRTGRLKTAEGAMAYSAPQIAGRDEPYRSAIREHLKGHTQGLEDLAIEMLARGLSVPPPRQSVGSPT